MALLDLYTACKIGPTATIALTTTAADKNIIGLFFDLAAASNLVQLPVLLILRADAAAYVRQYNLDDTDTANTNDLKLLADVYYPIVIEGRKDGGVSARTVSGTGNLFLTIASQLSTLASQTI